MLLTCRDMSATTQRVAPILARWVHVVDTKLKISWQFVSARANIIYQIFVGGRGGGITFIFQPGCLNQMIRPVTTAENMTIKRTTTGFGMKRPGGGVAASFFEGDFDRIFRRGGGWDRGCNLGWGGRIRLHRPVADLNDTTINEHTRGWGMERPGYGVTASVL